VQAGSSGRNPQDAMLPDGNGLRDVRRPRWSKWKQTMRVVRYRMLRRKGDREQQRIGVVVDLLQPATDEPAVHPFGSCLVSRASRRNTGPF